MPIITLRNSFDNEKVKALRNITYGETGTKGPLITKGLPPVNSQTLQQYGPFNDGERTTQVSSRLDDASRIAQIIAKNPKFMINQGLLKPVPKPNPGQGLLGQIATQVGSRILNTGKTVASTLAQVPVNGTGTHFVYSFGGFEYVKDNPRTPSTALGQFLQNNLGIGSGGVKGAGIALQGGTIIPDNEGQPNYGPVSNSNLTQYNSKFDLKDGATDFSILRPDLQNVFSLVKGLFGGGKSTPISPDNQGQAGYRTMREGELEYSSDFDLEGDPSTYLEREGGITDFTGQPTYTPQVESQVENKTSEFKPTEDPTKYVDREGAIAENRGQEAFTPPIETQLPEQDSDFKSEEAQPYTGKPAVESTSTANIDSIQSGQGFDQDTEKTYTGKDGRLNTSTDSVSSGLVGGDKRIGEDPTRTYLRIDTKGITRYAGRGAARKFDPQKKINISENNGENQSGPISVHQMPGQYENEAFPDRVSTARTNLAPTENNDLFIPRYHIYKLNKEDGAHWKDVDSRLEQRMSNKRIKDYIDTVGQQTEQIIDKDIIPFHFNVREVGGENKYLYFKAYLDSLNDSFTGTWQGTKYIGRAEEFFTYDGFTRELSFSFKVAAFSREHLKPMYEKLNFLAGTTAPTYDSTGQFMRGTLTTVTIGDYLSQQVGYMSGVSLTWETNYPWEIDLHSENYGKVPHVLNVECNFTPIHEFNVKSDLNQEEEVYFGKKQNVAATKKEGSKDKSNTDDQNKDHTAEKSEIEYFYTSGMTYTIDKKTRKVIAINGQPTKYTNGGFAYEADGRQAVITKVNGSNATIFEDEEGNAIPVDDNGEPVQNIATEMLEEVVITAPRNTSSPSTEQPVNVNSQSPAVVKKTTVDTTTVQENSQGEAPTTKTTVTQTVFDGTQWRRVNEETSQTNNGKYQVVVTYENTDTGKQVKGSSIGTNLNVAKSQANFKARAKAVGLNN